LGGIDCGAVLESRDWSISALSKNTDQSGGPTAGASGLHLKPKQAARWIRRYHLHPRS